ncbi:LON peptidase substrate-binding domain-containing protein, partial [Streptosporangium algeriense]
MSESLILPVLPLDDEVVLPGMVVPLDLSEGEIRAAIDAARALADNKPEVLLVPRIDGKYGAVGVRAVVEQVGRLPGGEPAAVVRGV